MKKEIRGIIVYIKQEDTMVKEWFRINKGLFEIKNIMTGISSSMKACSSLENFPGYWPSKDKVNKIMKKILEM